MTPAPLRIHLALFTVALLFSLSYVVSKLGMREFSPLTFAWLRVAGSTVILAMLPGAFSVQMERRDSVRIVGYSLLGVVINQTLFLAGLSFTTVQVAAILATAIPVFALAVAIGLGAEVPSMTRTAGIALAAAGALLVVGGEGFRGDSRSLIGTVMILLNCLSYAIYLVVSKPTMTRLAARPVVTRMFAWATVILLPIAASSLIAQDWGSISPRAWIALGLVILGPTVLGYSLNAWALRHTDSSVIAAYTYVQPVLASLFGAFAFGETLRSTVVLAAAMIFFGVWLAGRVAQVGPIPD